MQTFIIRNCPLISAEQADNRSMSAPLCRVDTDTVCCPLWGGQRVTDCIRVSIRLSFNPLDGWGRIPQLVFLADFIGSDASPSENNEWSDRVHLKNEQADTDQSAGVKGAIIEMRFCSAYNFMHTVCIRFQTILQIMAAAMPVSSLAMFLDTDCKIGLAMKAYEEGNALY